MLFRMSKNRKMAGGPKPFVLVTRARVYKGIRKAASLPGKNRSFLLTFFFFYYSYYFFLISMSDALAENLRLIWVQQLSFSFSFSFLK